MKLATRAVSALAAVVVTIGVAACSSSDTPDGAAAEPTAITATTTATPAPTASPTPAPTATGDRPRGGLGGFDPAVIQQAQECLQAAGIAVPTERPSGFESGFPSDFSPRASPSAGATRRPGAGSGRTGLFSSPAAQAALQACGIVLPSAPADGALPG